MRRLWSVLGSLAFLVVAPGTLAGFVPWWLTGWQAGPWPAPVAVRIAGAVFGGLGAAVLLESFARFALHGLGTPAPIMPTRILVVTGLYRFVRNPMYLGVTAAILGQAALLGQPVLAIYGAVVWLGFHLFVLAYEEPTLRQTYGEQYAAYGRNVGRWLPRISPYIDGHEPSRPAG